MKLVHTPFRFVLLAFLALVVLAACSEDAQEKYEEATEKLQEARTSRNEAQEQLKEKKEELAEMRANLNESESKLKTARKKIDEASQNVDKTVNDQVLFRTIQRSLLDKDFEESAISVGVQDRVVTLTGNVPDQDSHERALKTARQTAGVKNVVDQLKVGDAQSAPGNDKAASQTQQPPSKDRPAQGDEPKSNADSKPDEQTQGNN